MYLAVLTNNIQSYLLRPTVIVKRVTLVLVLIKHNAGALPSDNIYIARASFKSCTYEQLSERKKKKRKKKGEPRRKRNPIHCTQKPHSDISLSCTFSANFPPLPFPPRHPCVSKVENPSGTLPF